jgi:hydroxyacylglutathione hydrolase
MKRINKLGPRVLGAPPRPERLPAVALGTVLGRGAVVVDARPAAAFAAGHVPGTINVPLNASFTTWAGWLLPYDRDVYLLVDDAAGRAPDAAARDLAMIGLDRVGGVFGRDAVDAWVAGGRPLGTVARTTPAELAEGLARGEVTVVDVRGRSEWEAGHLPGVPNVPLGYLTERLGELPTTRPVVVQCQGGTRSAIAASVLQAHGVSGVLDLAGGFAAWRDAGLPVETGAATEEPVGA